MPDHSALTLSRFLAKSPQMLGNLQAQPGLRACLRKGKWRRKGNRESERLWVGWPFAQKIPGCSNNLTWLGQPMEFLQFPKRHPPSRLATPRRRV